MSPAGPFPLLIFCRPAGQPDVVGIGMILCLRTDEISTTACMPVEIYSSLDLGAMSDNDDNKLPVTTAVTVAAPPSSSRAIGGAVRLVSAWAMLAAWCIILVRAVDWILYSCFHVPCDPVC